ncbi:MAG: hypothetical protein GX573_02840 [Chloroflexi bacterium]|nr:hypothetical protein [Chloroflexota bacterium]
MSDLVARARQLYELAWLGKSARIRELATARLDAAMRALQGTDPVRYQALCEELIARAAELAARRAALERQTEVQA